MKATISTIWVIFLLFATSCNTSKQATETKTANTDSKTESQANQPIISFEQTACFGTCPVHKMEIFKNGTAVYLANRNVKTKGKFKITLPKNQVQQILDKAQELNFFELKDEYTANMTDLPTTIIYINDGKNQHKVVAYTGYPENLKEFIKYLYEFTQSVEWEGEK